MSGLARLKSLLYKGSLFVSLVLLIGFSVVLPIDSIAQASKSENNAFNTFIVVGALVVFGVFCIVIIIGRMLFHKSCLRDIPRRYIPITLADLPHRSSRESVLQNMERSKELTILLKKPKDPVIHDGLEPPKRCDYPSNEKLFPEYLNYADCIKSLTDRLKYHGLFLNNLDVRMKLEDTFADVVKSQFVNRNANKVQLEKAKEFIDLYETIRFSGKDVTRHQFINFVELCLYFGDMTLTRDTSFINLQNFKLNGSSNNVVRTNESKYSINPFDENEYAQDDMSYFPEPLTHLVKESSRSTVARHVSSAADLAHSEEPPFEADSDCNAFHDKLTEVDSYRSVIRH
ncbi:dlt1p [Saccharomyces arboricola H-6]|uniref:Defect at low temperature protein 1 n=1 Tax=Saccharomyces arboricola (strain H-6 / AS 2.3317 / CBS 10644) TaxID=1160507 RepID=J8Q9H7_SACAR|nr:dlt1p [Saccharomyces arboricola H-6]